MSYPSCITQGDQKRHYDVFARLRVITDWPGFAEQQRDRRQWLRQWLEANTDLTDQQYDEAKPVLFCDLPQPDASGDGPDSERAFISEREVWWNLDDLGDEMQSMKSDNRDWLEKRRSDVKGEHSSRFDKLSIATKHDPQWSDWKSTHDTTTGKKKPPKEDDWRSKSASWHDSHLGITEDPSGSNRDSRSDGISASQRKCAGGGSWLIGQPWCGVWAFRGLLAAEKVKEDGSASWLASVAQIENYARAGRAPFKGWTTDGSKASKGDLVVLFGRGIHVGTVQSVSSSYVKTWEGNTSSASSGSQSNGGGSFERDRSRASEVYGYALVA